MELRPVPYPAGQLQGWTRACPRGPPSVAPTQPPARSSGRSLGYRSISPRSSAGDGATGRMGFSAERGRRREAARPVRNVGELQVHRGGKVTWKLLGQLQLDVAHRRQHRDAPVFQLDATAPLECQQVAVRSNPDRVPTTLINDNAFEGYGGVRQHCKQFLLAMLASLVFAWLRSGDTSEKIGSNNNNDYATTLLHHYATTLLLYYTYSVTT